MISPRLRTKLDLLKRSYDALLQKQWDESKHPRDQRGRFGHGSGGGEDAASRVARLVAENAQAHRRQVVKQVLWNVGVVGGTLLAGKGAAVGGRILIQAGTRASEARLAEMIPRIAGKMKFDPAQITVVRAGIGPYTGFGGIADMEAGSLKLMSDSLAYHHLLKGAKAVEGIIVHEITHLKFAAFQKAKVGFLGPPRGAMHVMGVEVEPAVGQGFENSMWGAKAWKTDPKLVQLAKDDGVSKYSKMYWDAFNKGKVSEAGRRLGHDESSLHFIAMHETVAEMGRIHHETGKLPGSAAWKELYHEMNRSWHGIEI